MYQRWGPLNFDRFAAIADVHGNVRALEAVLGDIGNRGINTVVNLGDSLFGPLNPDETAELLIPLKLPTVAGNQDRELLEPAATQHIRIAQRDWLATLPPLMVIDDIALFHGTPPSDSQYLTETVHPGGVTLSSDKEIRARLGPSPLPRLLLCGHTHIPRVVALQDRLIVNPGSVGLQAYSDETPLPHIMETGSPHARYAILERTATGWNVEQIQLCYDWNAAALDASANGRHDWAYRLSTGRAR